MRTSNGGCSPCGSSDCRHLVSTESCAATRHWTSRLLRARRSHATAAYKRSVSRQTWGSCSWHGATLHAQYSATRACDLRHVHVHT